MKKFTAFLSALFMCFALIGCSAQEQEAEPITDSFLAKLEGSYVELFPTLSKDEYHDMWLDAISPIMGEDMAEDMKEVLLGMCTAEIYGDEASQIYKTSDNSAFNCYFLGGVDKFTISGNEISGTDENGNEVFRHTYSPIENNDDNGFLYYKSDDENAGQFTYFAFAPDTPAETYHIEFRYSENPEDLKSFFEGNYAFWNAAGILENSSEQDIKNCIELFVNENVNE